AAAWSCRLSGRRMALWRLRAWSWMPVRLFFFFSSRRRHTRWGTPRFSTRSTTRRCRDDLPLAERPGAMKARIAFIAALLCVAFAGPLRVDAQQTAKVPRIGYLSGATPATGGPFVDSFKQGLRELGYVEGKTYVLEVRYSEGKSERLAELAHEM